MLNVIDKANVTISSLKQKFHKDEETYLNQIRDLKHQNKAQMDKILHWQKQKIEQSEKIKNQCKELVDIALLKGQAHGSEETIRKLTAAQEKRLQHISEIHSKQLKMEREKYEKLIEAKNLSTQQAMDDMASLSVTRLQDANDMEVKSSIMKEKLVKREEQIEELKEVVNELQQIADDRLSICNKAKVDMTLFRDKLKEREKQLLHKNNIIDKIREELQESGERSNMHQVQLMATNEIISEYKVNMRKICLKNLSLLFRKTLSSKVKISFSHGELNALS